MPPKRTRGPIKAKKTKQTLLPGARPPTDDVVPAIPTRLDPTLRRVALEALKPIEPKRYAWSWNHMPSDDLETRYFNKTTRVIEWRCAYCKKR